MITLRIKLLGAVALVASQLMLNACQSTSEIVLPSQTVAANPKVTVSDWVTIDGNSWTVSPKSSQLHIAGFVDSSVTNSVVESGLVVAFYRHSAAENVYALPITVGNQAISFTYYAMNDKGIISFQQKAGQIIEGEYRWVVVPKEAAKHVDWTNYEAVKQELALPE